MNDTDIHFEAHIEVDPISVEATSSIKKQIEAVLHDTYAINHTTLQFECGLCGDESIRE